ncbi:hypothetical protein CR513_26548, partial [Mucuna pruriens]
MSIPTKAAYPSCAKLICQHLMVQDQDLGSWKLSEVIARYSQRTPVDGNLNVWPSVVHHRCPSKAIVAKGGFSRNSEFLTLYSIYFFALKYKPPLFTVLPGPRSIPVRLCRVCLSRNHIGSSSRSPIEIIPVALKLTDIKLNPESVECYNVSATQQPVQQLNSSPSLEDLVQQFQQNKMQFQQNINATMQELKAQIGQLATTINQLQFEGSKQVPSQTILSPQENMSDIIVRSGMELLQQQSLKVQYGLSRNPNSENSTNVPGFANSSSVANSMLAATNSTKMAEIDDYVPTIFDLADVVKIANSMTDVIDLTDMTLDEISNQVTRVEIVDPTCVDDDITNPMCADAKMVDPRYANVDNAFADRAEDADSLVDKSDSVRLKWATL